MNVYIFNFPGGSSGKEPPCQCRRGKRHRFDPRVRKILWRRAWQPTPVLLPGESQEQRSQGGYSPWVAKSRTRLKQLAPVHIFPLRTFSYSGSEYQSLTH